MKIFGQAKQLIHDIDLFFDAISRAALVFKSGIHDYMNHRFERMQARAAEVFDLEKEADLLRRSIEQKLYSQMLIPDARGDVLGILETSDNVIDRAKKLLNAFDIEKPEIPDSLTGGFCDLADASYNAMDEMVKAARSFFHEVQMVNDHNNKVYYYEHEADKLEDHIKRKAFETDEITRLSQRVQMRYFAERIAQLSDDAEAVSDRLSIAAIKRSI